MFAPRQQLEDCAEGTGARLAPLSFLEAMCRGHAGLHRSQGKTVAGGHERERESPGAS